MARYDYGLRGYREAVPGRRRPGRVWHLRPMDEDPRDEVRGYGPGGPPSPRGYRSQEYRPIGNRVTSRYNRDYVYPDRARYEVNHNPYGGDNGWRMGDFTTFERPYMTTGGSYTYRGGSRVGWEREYDGEMGPYRQARYDAPYRRDYDRHYRGRW